MKTFVTFVLCSSLFLVGGNALAKKKHARQPHRIVIVRDEVVLSRGLMREVERRLDDGGYPPGAIDGRITRRTRRAIAEFQRDYHMRPSGALDMATAEALLGRERLRGFLVAKN